MNLYENILRISNLIYENNLNESFVEKGQINNAPGLNITLKENRDTKIGETNLIHMQGACENDDYVKRFMDSDNGKINDHHFIYVHDLKVEEEYKGKGYGKKIMTKCHEIAKNLGYDYTCLIVEHSNHIAQSLYKKLGYETHKKDDYGVFLIKKL